MSPSQSNDRRSPRVEALDLIYSCVICHDTLDKAYQNDENEDGLKHGRQADSHGFTRMWLASCGHVFCGKRLEGGGSTIADLVR